MIKKRDLLIAIISLIAGAAIVYFYNLHWVLNTRDLTNNLIANFRDTYDIQRNLSLNYSNSYDELVNCLFVEKSDCKVEEKVEKFKQISLEREQLKSQLEQKNKEAEIILSKLP